MDLACLRARRSEAAANRLKASFVPFTWLTIVRIKEATFTWLNVHYRTCGWFRRSESGRPYLKCNDCGVRFLEAQCDKTIEEWLEMDLSHQKLLVSNQVIGPELFFSPLVLFEVTHFRCGGISLGLSWAHVLGDAFAASDFINGLGQNMSALEPNRLPNYTTSNTKFQKLENVPPPLPIKQVNPVGDHWITPINSKVREGSEPKLVTICKNDPKERTRGECSNNADFYGLEVKGHKPVYVHYNIQGVGDEGAVLLLPGPKDFGEGRGEGRAVNIILPEKVVFGLKSELRKNDLLLENEL
ncbi:protein ECERIFERUM 26-like [Prunus avium]|uniref:Protein ECERIFERUM 26-like n=1 Tax=Prunus avium TaxID=42229 RepID=A0A6P5U3Z7_PRUAV|nr:protein ECERIFERUM 26-like [Prunus avium]